MGASAANSQQKRRIVEDSLMAVVLMLNLQQLIFPLLIPLAIAAKSLAITSYSHGDNQCEKE